MSDTIMFAFDTSESIDPEKMQLFKEEVKTLQEKYTNLPLTDDVIEALSLQGKAVISDFGPDGTEQTIFLDDCDEDNLLGDVISITLHLSDNSYTIALETAYEFGGCATNWTSSFGTKDDVLKEFLAKMKS